MKATAMVAASQFLPAACIGLHENAMPRPSSAAAFAASSIGAIGRSHRARSKSVLQRAAVVAAYDNNNNDHDHDHDHDHDDYDNDAAATTTLLVPEPASFRIRPAEYSELGQAADLMTDCFHPELIRNPFLRPIRYFAELDRLQTNFPYEENDRHYYLVVCEDEKEEGGSTTADDGNQERVIGFCDVDGRIPAAGFSLSRFVPDVVRPRPYLSDLAVRSDRRRRGVASALMVEAERLAREMGFDELYLGVRSTNELALRMYDGIGYESIVPDGDVLAFLDMQKGVDMLRRSLDDVC